VLSLPLVSFGFSLQDSSEALTCDQFSATLNIFGQPQP
jgi:hypothetical protein